MNKEAEQPTPKGDEAPKGDEFEKRHGKELGVKRFAKVQGAYIFIPLLTATAGALLGYYAFARPLAKLFPKLSKMAGSAEAAASKLSGSIGDLWKGKPLPEVFEKFKPNAEQLEALGKIWGEGSALSKVEQLNKSVEVLNLASSEVTNTFRLGSGVAIGTIGMMGGGIATGYDKWHKDESARLAAQEINGDIAKLELFKPSDPELLAENKRLSAMVAALPTIDAATAERQGRVEEKQQAASK